MPLAIAVMKEVGIDISGHRSKSLDKFVNEKFGFVITLCDHAAESGPVFFGGTQRIHMGFPNPKAASGSDEERLMAFREVCNQTGGNGCLLDQRRKAGAMTPRDDELPSRIGEVMG
jgi:arsenate reductase (thioredoxin)